jgi:hypothetical protein
VTDADFRFTGLGFARYAIVVESEGFTPVYRLGLRVAPDGTDGGQLQHQFDGEQALVVHPLTSALAPQVGDPTVILDAGQVLIRGDSAPVLVLPFVSQADVALGITGMRLAATPRFSTLKAKRSRSCRTKQRPPLPCRRAMAPSSCLRSLRRAALTTHFRSCRPRRR